MRLPIEVTYSPRGEASGPRFLLRGSSLLALIVKSGVVSSA
jgi:hypothetical protein